MTEVIGLVIVGLVVLNVAQRIQIVHLRGTLQAVEAWQDAYLMTAEDHQVLAAAQTLPSEAA